MNKTTAYTITGTGRISAVIGSKAYTVDKDHPNYSRILDTVKSKAWDEFVKLTDLAKGLTEYITGDVQISDGAIIYAGEVLHNTLTKRILNFMRDDLPFEPLTKFLANLVQNPSKRAVDELYDFLEAGELPITEDGFLLAFKNIRNDWKDIHSGTFDNSVGKVCEMPRNRCDEDKNRTCSQGLHFCSIQYLPHFSDSNGGRTVIVKINPKDVTSFPIDYNNTKGRCCRYEVVAEYTDDWRKRVQIEGDNGFDAELYTSDGEEWYDEEDEEIYGTKPSGHKFYNKRNDKGQFA